LRPLDAVEADAMATVGKRRLPRSPSFKRRQLNHRQFCRSQLNLCSHCKSMRFRGQRPDPLLGLPWSPSAPVCRKLAPEGRFESSPALQRWVRLENWSKSPEPLQLYAPKGDMQKVSKKSTFLLTQEEKPSIINSFHRGRGAWNDPIFPFVG
jgi:hypothetical protein